MFGEAAYLHAPDFRTRFHIGPGKGAGIACFKLIMQRTRIVIIDDLERRSRLKMIDQGEDRRVALDGRNGAHVEEGLHRGWFV